MTYVGREGRHLRTAYVTHHPNQNLPTVDHITPITMRNPEVQNRTASEVTMMTARLQMRRRWIALFAAPSMVFLRIVVLSEALAFQTATAPRFDAFCDNIVGPCFTSANGEQQLQQQDVDEGDGNGVDGGERMVVEEVMRSCGGAVQGIREVDGTYLNRADDGFVFCDDGSYSYGPAQLPNEDSSSTSSSWLTSISLTKKHRILMVHGGGPDDDLDSVILLSREGVDEHVSTAITTTASASFLVPLQVPDSGHRLQWLSVTRCRMPSSSQPWMLQRSQWETKEAATQLPCDQESEEYDDDLQAGISSYVNLEDAGDRGTVFSAGVTCRAIGLTKAFERVYNSKGSLTSVSFLHRMTQIECPIDDD